MIDEERSRDRRFRFDNWQCSAPFQYIVLSGCMLANSLVLPLAFGEQEDTAVVVGASLAIAVARVLTVPTDVADAWDQYVHTSNPCMAPHLRPEAPELEVGLTTVPGGLGVQLRF